MTQEMRRGSKRFRKGWIALGFICAGVVFFHKPLLLMGCKALLSRAIPQAEGRIVSYESMRWEEGAIALSGLQVKDPSAELTVDRIELRFKGDFSTLVFKPELKVVHPQILFFSSGNSSALPLLYRTGWIQPRWEVSNGVLQLPSASRFYFSIAPGMEEGSMGKLLFSHDPNLEVSPLFTADLIASASALQVGFKLNESDISRLLPLTSLLFTDVPRNWEKANGEVEFEGLLCLDDAFEVQELHCHGAGKNLALSGTQIDVHCEEIKGAFSYPVGSESCSFWDKLSASLFIKSGGCHWSSSLGMNAIDGDLSFDPESEPHLQLSGVLLHEEKETPFILLGKGGVQPDSTFWSEVALTSKSSNGTDLQALFSLCSHEEGDLALHVKLDDAQFDQLDFLRAFNGIPGVCVEGSAAIEATFLYHKSRWQKASVENCHFDKVRWFFPTENRVAFAEQIAGDCEWVFSGKAWELKDLHVQMLSGDYLDSEVHLEGLASNVVIEKGELEPSLLTGQWGDLFGEVAMHGGDPISKTAVFSATFSSLSALWPSLRLEGNLKCEGGHLKASNLFAECEGLAMRGMFDLPLQTQGQFSLSTSQIAGNVESLFALLNHFPALPQLKLPIQGNFSSGEKGFFLTLPMGSEAEAEWGFKGTFDHLSLPVNALTAITDGRCDVVFDSSSKKLCVEKGEGTWTLMDGTAFSVQVKQLATQKSDQVDFHVKVVDGKKEFALIEGKALASDPNGWEIHFEPKSTHFGGTHLNISRCFMNEAMQLTTFEMKPIFKCQDLHAQAAFLQNAGFIPTTFSPKNLQEWELEGTLQAQLFSEDLTKGFSLHAESRDLKVKGKPWSAFQLKAQKIGEKWLIEKLDAGSLQLKGAFIVEGETLNIPQFEGKWDDILMKGSGSVKPEEKRFFCHFESVRGPLNYPKGTFAAGVSLTGDFSNPQDPLLLAGDASLSFDIQAPLQIGASAKKKVKFTYGKENGLVCDGIDFQLKHKISGAYLGDIKAAKLQQPQAGDLSLQQLQLSLSPVLLGHCIDAKLIPSSFKELEWEGNLEVTGDFQLAQGAPVFQGSLKPGRYGYAGKSFPIEQLQLHYEKQILSTRLKTEIEEQPLWGSVQIDLTQEPFGAIKVFDSPKAEGLRLLFTTQKGIVHWESIQGSCYGMHCSLAKNTKSKVPLASLLSGEISVDGNALSSLFPKAIREGVESLKFGSGYKWKGDLTLWQEGKRGFTLSGILEGRDFEAFGYLFHSLSGNIQATPEHVFITDLKIDDQAGLIGIKKIELNKDTQWHLNIPQVKVAHLQPSLMRRVDGTEQVIKPFLIKNFTLSDIKGRLGDKSSLEGSGHLTFANQFKKESSLLDIPLEMLKKIGLDPGLLTPVHGELQMELCGDKFYLVALENAFSDGERAEFYLSPEHDLSFIDLDGKVSINLKMHQDVMLKITEPFTLTIRGTLEKPRYGLQY